MPGLFVEMNLVWVMPTLFAVAGMSSAYALEKRSFGAYVKERISKLLLPFVFGLLLVVPIQPYLASLYNGADANYLNFFMRFGDLTGIDGSFTVGHLWFILYLLVISMISLPVMMLYKSKSKKVLAGKIPLVILILIAVIPVLTHPLLNIANKSVGEYMTFFLLGYFILAREEVLIKLDQYRFWLLGISVAGSGVSLYFHSVLFEAASWLSILAILGLARHYLNFNGKITGYLVKSSFGVYLFHLSWIVVLAFFIFKIDGQPILQIPLVLVSAVALTYLTYEGCRRVSVFRWMFGLKK